MYPNLSFFFLCGLPSRKILGMCSFTFFFYDFVMYLLTDTNIIEILYTFLQHSYFFVYVWKICFCLVSFHLNSELSCHRLWNSPLCSDTSPPSRSQPRTCRPSSALWSFARFYQFPLYVFPFLASNYHHLIVFFFPNLQCFRPLLAILL